MKMLCHKLAVLSCVQYINQVDIFCKSLPADSEMSQLLLLLSASHLPSATKQAGELALPHESNHELFLTMVYFILC